MRGVVEHSWALRYDYTAPRNAIPKPAETESESEKPRTDRRMAIQRVGISEADIAMLGEPGVEQNIPIAEKVAGEVATARRTTITDMAAYFASQPNQPNVQIQRVYLNAENDNQILVPEGLENREETPFILNGWRKREDSLIAGSSEFYTIIDGIIQFPNIGVYRVNCRIKYLKDNDSFMLFATEDEIVFEQPQWTPVLQITSGTRTEELWGNFISNNPVRNLNETGGIQASTIITTQNENQTIQTRFYFLNIGGTVRTRFERFELIGHNSNQSCEIEIELLQMALPPRRANAK